MGFEFGRCSFESAVRVHASDVSVVVEQLTVATNLPRFLSPLRSPLAMSFRNGGGRLLSHRTATY